MKTHKYIFEKVATIENITLAIWKASENKRNRKEVIKVLEDIDYHAQEIYEMLWSKKYKPCKVVESVIKEGSKQKKRVVTRINFFPDQIIHWAAILQIGPIISNRSYEYSCGSMPGKGVHKGKKYIERWVVKDRKNTKYVAKADISKFYPSVQHHIIKKELRTIIKDPKMLWLLDSIIDSYRNGLPIGYLTSQWFANFLLQKLDYMIKQDLKIKHYVRYMDDIVMFGSNKKKLRKALLEIMNFLYDINLKLKPNYQIFKLDARALDFMGFRFFRHKVILRKSLMYRITRKAAKIKKKSNITNKDASSMISYMGWVKHSQTYKVYNNWIKAKVKIKDLKQIIRNNSKNEELKKHEDCKIRKQRNTNLN